MNSLIGGKHEIDDVDLWESTESAASAGAEKAVQRLPHTAGTILPGWMERLHLDLFSFSWGDDVDISILKRKPDSEATFRVKTEE